MPALLYGKYGKGYVVEWTTVPVPSYMDGTTADIVIHRMILGLLPEPTAHRPQTTVATPRTTAATQETTVVVTQPPTVITTANPTLSDSGNTETTGEVMVYSSPTGASILIDGIYLGTTPGKVNGIPAGNHILRLTMSGYYDYEGSIYVVAGETTQGYGTLQPMNQVTSAAPTPVPTVIVTGDRPVIPVTPEPTQEKGLLENSSVLVAIIGVITALIAAGASIFTHVKPPKKE